MSANPYQWPFPMDEPLPKSAIKRAMVLVLDARHAMIVGVMPFLGLVYVWRLAEWYLLRSRFPILLETHNGLHASLANDLNAVRWRFWFAVLFWPVGALAGALLWFMAMS